MEGGPPQSGVITLSFWMEGLFQSVGGAILILEGVTQQSLERAVLLLEIVLYSQ